MTSEAKVKLVYPGAYFKRYKDYGRGSHVFIWAKPMEEHRIGTGKTAAEAWSDAASRLTLVSGNPLKNQEGTTCGLCDGTHEHAHPTMICTDCGVTGLVENMPTHRCSPITEADLDRMDAFLKERGWLRAECGNWSDPITGNHDPTSRAYAIAKQRLQRNGR